MHRKLGYKIIFFLKCTVIHSLHWNKYFYSQALDGEKEKKKKNKN